MFNFISGTIFGIIISSIGFKTLATVFDAGMVGIQKTTIHLARPQLPPPTNPQ